MLGWGIDVDPYEGPTEEQYEQLRQFRKKRIQEMIDLGVNISPDTWPLLPEHFDEEWRLTRLKNGEEVGSDVTGDNDDSSDLPW